MNQDDEPLLVYDNPTFKLCMRSFRSPKWDIDSAPNRYLPGLSNLNASASGQFSKKSLLHAFEGKRYKEIWIVDLRLESHGFIDGHAISWYGKRNEGNIGLNCEQVTTKESKQLKELSEQDKINVGRIIDKTSGVIKKVEYESVAPKLIETEAQLTKRLGFGYIRLPILDRHPPNDETIDKFLSFVKDLPENAWVHFHCRGGKGRATALIVLYDIYKNGTNVSLEDILDRQSYFGPKDLRKLPWRQEDIWKTDFAAQRLKLVKSFYEFRNSEDFFNKSWTQWKSEQV